MSTPSGIVLATKTLWSPQGVYLLAYLEKLSATTFVFGPMLAADVTSIAYTIYYAGVSLSTGTIATTYIFTPANTTGDAWDQAANPLGFNFAYLFGQTLFAAVGTYTVRVILTLTSGEKLPLDGQLTLRDSSLQV